MDTVLETFLTWQFILFCLAVTAFTYVVRIVVDYILNSKGIIVKQCKLWSDMILPILPIVVGSVSAFFAKQYPYPVEIHTTSGRIAYGLVVGLLATSCWRVVKAALSNKFGIKIQDSEETTVKEDK